MFIYNLAFFHPVWLFFRRGLAFFSRDIWQPCCWQRTKELTVQLRKACRGPRVHLSGPAYTTSCKRPEVRFPFDQPGLRSDCCKKL